MKKTILFFAAVLLVLAIAGAYFYSHKEALVLKKVSQGLQSLSGSPAELTGTTLYPEKIFSRWKFQAQKIVIRNQGKFRFDKLAVIENVEIEFDPLALFSGKWKIQKLSADVHRSYFQINPEGVLNAAQLPGIKKLMDSAALPSAASGLFHADRVELTYGKFYYVNDQAKPQEKKTYALEGKVDVYMHVNNPDLLVQAPLFMYLSQMNLGSFGLPRGKLQESIKQYVGQ